MDVDAWLQTRFTRISGKTPLAAAIAYTLIETAKLNDVDPQAWLTDVLANIADNKITDLEDLMPWSYAQRD